VTGGLKLLSPTRAVNWSTEAGASARPWL